MTRSFFLIAIAFLFSTNCFSKTEFTSTQDPLLLSLVSLQNPDCNNPLGAITVLATGGTPGYTYVWDAGATGPTITGITTGDYVVVVTDDDGNSAELHVAVLANFTPPLADAGAPFSVSCSNTVASLNGSGSAGPDFTYQWVASNGGHILADGGTLSPTVDHAGNFQLTVTDLSNGCTASASTTVTEQYNAPNASATGGVIKCTPNTVTLAVNYATTNTTFYWQGPGGFNSTLANPIVNVAGNYVFNITDTITGCTNKSTAVVSSNLTQPNVDATGGGTITCAQTSVQLSGISTTPGAVFAWTGPNGYTSPLQNPVANTAGTYTLKVTNPANGCTASDPIVVASNLTAPIPTAMANGTLTCNVQFVQVSGLSNTPGVSYAWTGPNNFMSSLQNALVSAPGTYTLTVKNPVNGCTGTASVNVIQNITPPNISAMGATKTCSSPTVTLNGFSTTPGATFSWTGPGGFTSNQQNPSVSATGNYTLKVTNPQTGCTATATASVSQNTTPPSVSGNSATITCTNPLAKITTNASPQGLSFSWSGPNNFSSTLQNPMVGSSGYYYVTATNPSNGCTNTAVVYTPDNITPPFAYAGEDKSLNCYFSTVLINASFSSNGSNFTYLWTTYDGNIVTGANTLYPSVNLEGTYTLKIVNTQNGCISYDSMIVTQSLPVTANINQTNPVYCAGGSNGSATVTAGGGSQNYTYNWSNGKLTPSITGLSAGVYTVTVTDSEGCTATSSATISQLVLSANVNVMPQTIPGVNNGSATVIGAGGTSPYSAKWSNGAMTTTINNLAPGSYTVTLTDAQGCTVVKTANVNAANCILNGTISGTNVSCFGSNNGTATINLSSFLNPITYAWSNGGAAKTVTGLAPGTYTVTATDGSGCQVTQTIQITGPQQLLASIVSQSNVHCPGTADGSITAGATGGTQPYTYLWSNNSSSASISNLNPGTYTLTVTDAKSCTNTMSAQVSSPSPITITVVQKTDVSCPNGNTGAVSVSVAGGIPPYKYFWSNGSTTAVISGLTPGNYTLTVTDNNDCPKSLSAAILVLDQTAPVLNLKNATVDLDANGTVSISSTLLDNGSTDNCGIVSWTVTPNTFGCGQTGANTVTVTATDQSGLTSTGTAIVTVVDNIAPSVICPSNILAGGCTPLVQFNLPQVIDNCPFNPAQLVQLSGLPSGSTFPPRNTIQTYQYTDQGGNIGQCSFEVYVEEVVTLAINSTPGSCAGNCDGAISLNQIAGGSFSLLWSNGQTNQSITGLCPGTYTATITDAFNCTQTQTAVISVVDAQAPTLTCPANITVGYCNGPVMYTLPIVTDNCLVNPANLQLVAGLPSGNMFPIGTTQQSFSYMDGGGNTGQCSFSVNVTGPSTQSAVVQAVSCANLCNGSAQLTVNSGHGPFSILWSNGQTGPTASNLCAGNYTYTVTDFFGCLQSGAITVSQPNAILVAAGQVINDSGNSGSGSIEINVMGGVPSYSYQWTRNGQVFATTEDLNNLFQGLYELIVTDANACTKSSGIINVSNSVSTNTPQWDQALSIFPNPAMESVQLDFGAPLSQDAQLQLRNQNGQVVMTQRIGANTQIFSLELSTVPAGLCLVQLSLADGQTTLRKLVVVK